MYSRNFDTVPSLKLFFALLIFPVVLGSAVLVKGEPFYGVGQKIIDGDSFFVDNNGKTIEIRLYGVDCPEYSQPYSKKAKRFVKNLILHKKLKIIPYYKDTYGRMVAKVKYGDKLLNRTLIKAGFAWVHPRYCKQKICRKWKKDEAEAKKSARGLWRDDQPIAPWRWKREHRK